jgi:hypothetical protein
MICDGGTGFRKSTAVQNSSRKEMEYTNEQRTCGIWGFHSGDFEEFSHLVYDALQPVENRQKFQRNISPPSSVLKSKPNKKPARCRQQTLFGLLFSPVDGGDNFLHKVDWLSADYTALYPILQTNDKPCPSSSNSVLSSAVLTPRRCIVHVYVTGMHSHVSDSSATARA